MFIKLMPVNQIRYKAKPSLQLWKLQTDIETVRRSLHIVVVPTKQTGKHSVTSQCVHVLMAQRCAALRCAALRCTEFHEFHVQSNNHVPAHIKRTL